VGSFVDEYKRLVVSISNEYRSSRQRGDLHQINFPPGVPFIIMSAVHDQRLRMLLSFFCMSSGFKLMAISLFVELVSL
jgi:hypothetical protein